MIRGFLATTAWRVLRLRMEKTANILNKQSRTADRQWSSSFGVGHEANGSPKKIRLLREISQRTSDLGGFFV
jgi:hypothetical protein